MPGVELLPPEPKPLAAKSTFLKPCDNKWLQGSTDYQKTPSQPPKPSDPHRVDVAVGCQRKLRSQDLLGGSRDLENRRAVGGVERNLAMMVGFVLQQQQQQPQQQQVRLSVHVGIWSQALFRLRFARTPLLEI